MDGGNRIEEILRQLPGKDCGLCGWKTCAEFAEVVLKNPAEKERCVHLIRCGKSEGAPEENSILWKDSLGREYDFILDTFPGDPGPRETILPYNPVRVKDLDIKPKDIIIGRPMGMSCGCPVTHCGVVMDVDQVNGVISWCVTGPLGPRSGEHKDIGYYVAEAYEGIVKSSNKELKIGMRYWFMPRRCMLQWRHSGLLNFVNKRNGVMEVRIEGLMIG